LYKFTKAKNLIRRIFGSNSFINVIWLKTCYSNSLNMIRHVSRFKFSSCYILLSKPPWKSPKKSAQETIVFCFV
jgi:hypothetical protein